MRRPYPAANNRRSVEDINREIWNRKQKSENYRNTEKNGKNILYADKVLSGNPVFYFFHIDGSFCYIFHILANYGSICMV